MQLFDNLTQIMVRLEEGILHLPDDTSSLKPEINMASDIDIANTRMHEHIII